MTFFRKRVSISETNEANLSTTEGWLFVNDNSSKQGLLQGSECGGMLQEMPTIELELTEFDCNEHHHDGASVHRRSTPNKHSAMQPLSTLDTGDTGAKTTDNTRLQRRPFGGATGSRKTPQSAFSQQSTNCTRLLHHQCGAGEAKHCPLSLLWSLLELEWTMDGEKTAWHGQNRPSKAAMVVEQLHHIGFQPNSRVNSNQIVHICWILKPTPQHPAPLFGNVAQTVAFFK